VPSAPVILLSSSPEQEIKWRRGTTPAFTGEVALLFILVIAQDWLTSILLDSLEVVRLAGIHFNPRTHRGR
jgi:hypothetical protein